MTDSTADVSNLKKTFSLEEKQELCQEWQKTNLSRSQFIRQNNLPKAFHTWCNKFLGQQLAPTENAAWLPIVAKAKRKTLMSETAQLELKISCAGMLISLSIPNSQATNFIKEIANAGPAIR